MAFQLYILLVMWISMLAGVFGAIECKQEPVSMVLFRDGTVNGNGEKELMIQLAIDTIHKIPDGSKAFVALVGDQVDEIVTLNKTFLDLKWVDKLRSHEDMKQYGDTISPVAIDIAVNGQFTVNQYKTRAEIVVHFVSSAAKISDVPKNKKKTFVVVFGPSIQSIWKSVATGEDHLYIVKDKNDLATVLESLIRQINCDSHYYCDTNKFSPKKGYKCRNCSHVCAENLTELTGTCGLRCPHLRLKSQEEDLVDKPSSTIQSGMGYKVEDHKTSAIYAIVGTIGAVFFLLFIGVAIYCINKRKILTPSSSDETLRKTFDEEQIMMLTHPVQETVTGGLDSVHEDSSDSVHEGDLDSVHSGEPVTEPGDGSGPSSAYSREDCTYSLSENGPVTVSFKNKQEMDLNAHYSDSHVQILHEKPVQRMDNELGGSVTVV